MNEKVLKSLAKETKILVNFELTESEKKRMLDKALRYANGNLSEWIRYAAITSKTTHTEYVRLQARDPRLVFNFAVTKAEKRRMVENAKKYAQGNLSNWIRYTAITHEPNPDDLI